MRTLPHCQKPTETRIVIRYLATPAAGGEGGLM